MIHYYDNGGTEMQVVFGEPYYFSFVSRHGEKDGKAVFSGNCLSSDTIDMLISSGLLHKKEDNEKKTVLTVEGLIKFSNIPGHNIDERVTYLNTLYKACPVAAMNLVLKTASDYFNTKHKDSISSRNELWCISWFDLDVHRLCKRNILDTAYVSLFRYKGEAENALNIVLNLIKSNEDGK